MSQPATTTVAWQPLLPAEACEQLVGTLPALWESGQVATAEGAGVAPLRRTLVTPLRDPTLQAQLLAWLHALNAQMFGFDVDGFRADDPLLFLRYRPGDHYGWHIDAGSPQTATRKLSFTLQLSPSEAYDGGDLELALYSSDFGEPATSRQDQRQQGVVTVFPSFHLHRVTPVTRGERLALVGFLHGPPFR